MVGVAAALGLIGARMEFLSTRSDRSFPKAWQWEMAGRSGSPVGVQTIISRHGHNVFLLEEGHMGPWLLLVLAFSEP